MTSRQQYYGDNSDEFGHRYVAAQRAARYRHQLENPQIPPANQYTHMTPIPGNTGPVEPRDPTGDRIRRNLRLGKIGVVIARNETDDPVKQPLPHARVNPVEARMQWHELLGTGPSPGQLVTNYHTPAQDVDEYRRHVSKRKPTREKPSAPWRMRDQMKGMDLQRRQENEIGRQDVYKRANQIPHRGEQNETGDQQYYGNGERMMHDAYMIHPNDVLDPGGLNTRRKHEYGSIYAAAPGAANNMRERVVNPDLMYNDKERMFQQDSDDRYMPAFFSTTANETTQELEADRTAAVFSAPTQYMSGHNMGIAEPRMTSTSQNVNSYASREEETRANRKTGRVGLDAQHAFHGPERSSRDHNRFNPYISNRIHGTYARMHRHQPNQLRKPIHLE